jgi:hypothetical protein
VLAFPCSTEDLQQRNAGRNFQSDAATSQVHREPLALVNFGHAEGLYIQRAIRPAGITDKRENGIHGAARPAGKDGFRVRRQLNAVT